MKLRSSLSLGLIAVLALAPVVSRAAGPQPNLSFEQADPVRPDAPAGWVKNPANAPADWDASVAHHGSRSLSISGSGPTGASWLSEDRIPVTPGQVCTLTGWIKTEKAWGDNELKIVWYDAKGTWISTSRSEKVNGTKDWTKVTLSEPAPANAASLRLSLGRRHQTASGVCWFDNLEFTLGPLSTDASSPARIVNPPDWQAPRIPPLSFGDAPAIATDAPARGAREWTISVSSRAWESLSAIDGAALAEPTLSITSPAAAGAGWISRETFPVRPGVTYELAGLVSLDNALGGTTLALCWLDGEGRELSRSVGSGISGLEKSRLLFVQASAPQGANAVRAAFLRRSATGAIPGAGNSLLERAVLRDLSAAAPSPLNLVPNGDLEQSGPGTPPKPAHWTQVSPEQAQTEWLSLNAGSGRRALAITDSHGPTSGWLSASFPVEPNLVYEASLLLRLDNAFNVRVTVEWLDSSGRGIGLGSTDALGGSREWRRLSLKVKAPPASTAARLILTQSKSSGTSAFDDISFHRADTSEVPVLPPPSSDEIVVVPGSGHIDLYMKGSRADSARWLRYRMQNKPAPERRSDVWRWNEVWEVERTGPFAFSPIERVSTDGEVEFAVRQKGKSDFMGGFIHGNEIKTAATLEIDGNPLPFDTVRPVVARRVDFTQSSDLFEVDQKDPNRVARAFRRWHFENGTVVLSQRIEWEAPLELVDAYLAMLPLERKRGDKQITHQGARAPEWTIEDLASPGFPSRLTTSPAVKVWGLTGYAAEVEILEGWDLPKREFNISPAANYNKLYFDFTGDGYKTRPGDRLQATARFRIDTAN